MALLALTACCAAPIPKEAFDAHSGFGDSDDLCGFDGGAGSGPDL
jgi:hypothetical protein